MAGDGWNDFNIVQNASKLCGLMDCGKPPPPEDDAFKGISPEDIQRSIDRVKMVDKYVSSMKAVNSLCPGGFENGIRNRPFTSGMHSAFPTVELCPENIVDIKTLAEHAGKVVKGKFLLCRTITPAYQMRAIRTLVEDPAGEHAIRLGLFNYSTTIPRVTKFDEVVPTGSFLAIKNPWFSQIWVNGMVWLLCEDPSQVELLSLKAVTKMFPDVKWEGEIPQLDNFPNDNFWLTASGTDRETGEVLKKLGNAAFVDKRFTDGIRWYNLALEYSGDEDFVVEIHSNRAAMFLGIRCFHRALDDANKVLEKKPNHAKAVYRKTKALMGVERYSEASDFISEKLNTYEELGDNQELVQTAECARNLSSQLAKDVVDVDMMKLVKCDNVESIEDTLQFTGPVKRRLRKRRSGTCRGVVATEDVLPGRLLLSSKAFAFIRKKCQGSWVNMGLLDSQHADFQTGCAFNLDSIDQEHFDLCSQIAYKIYFEPKESGTEIYNLIAGPELGALGKDSNANGVVDILRIQRIIQCNSFGTSLAARMALSMRDVTYHTYAGLWNLPSFLNHSCCDVNAVWCNIGDMFILRAIKGIKKDEEIIVSTVYPCVPYELRMESFKVELCKCRLCELDLADKENGQAKVRDELLRKIQCSFQGTPRHLDVQVRMVMKTLAQLESLRGQDPDLNSCFGYDDVCRMARCFLEIGEVRKCRELLEKINEIQKRMGLVFESISSTFVLLKCSLELRDKKSVCKWVKELKANVINGYGCIEIVKMFKQEDLEVLGKLQTIGMKFFDE